MNHEFITNGKEFFIAFESTLVSGYMPVSIPKVDPVLRWHGPKIDLLRSWQPALKFMADHAGHEVVLRFFMTRDRSEIVIFPLTQYHGTGMSVQEAITKEEREEWAAEGLTEAGTLHSHCSGAAFASGTDSADEKTRDGLHVTIGKLRSAEYDIHSRMTWTIPGEERDGILIRASMIASLPPDLSDWFTLPEHVVRFIRLEPELEESVVKYCLTKPPGSHIQYPEAWKAKLIQKPIQQWAPSHHQVDLSMASDIPGFESFKKKEERRELPSGKKTNDLLWDLWSEVMSLIAESSTCRNFQVSVSDFTPEMRAHLFKQVPPAQIVWQAIKKLLAENQVTEEEFFDEFSK